MSTTCKQIDTYSHGQDTRRRVQGTRARRAREHEGHAQARARYAHRKGFVDVTLLVCVAGQTAREDTHNQVQGTRTQRAYSGSTWAMTLGVSLLLLSMLASFYLFVLQDKHHSRAHASKGKARSTRGKARPHKGHSGCAPHPSPFHCQNASFSHPKKMRFGRRNPCFCFC